MPFNSEGVIGFIQNYGMIAIFISILLEYACFPVPSEIVLPFAGACAAFWGIPFTAVWLLSIAAALCGCMVCYIFGRAGGVPILTRISGRYRGAAEGIEASKRWFDKYGGISVMAGRVLPICRTYISFIAGMSQQPVYIFLGFSAVGAAVWNLLLTGFGYQLAGKWGVISVWAERFSILLLPAVALAVFCIVCRIRRSLHREK